MPSLQDLGLPAFRPRFPWLGADLQTTRNFLVPAPPALAGERLLLPVQDDSGDRLAGVLHQPAPAHGQDGPAAVLMVHGLSGTEDSRYMLHAARHLLSRGHPVIRLNLRGSGPSRRSCRRHYHAGSSADLRDALLALPATLRARGVVVLGFSLGGNIALKFAAEHAAALPVQAVISVSAPIDLAATSRNMLRRRNMLYNRRLLDDFKRENLAPGAAVSPEHRAALQRARSFLDVDHDVVAPRNGFADAWEYCARTMALPYLADIRVPTLLIHAVDDPIVPSQAYLDYPWQQNPRLRALLPASGGHVGFHGHGPLPWHLLAIGRFLDKLDREPARDHEFVRTESTG